MNKNHIIHIVSGVILLALLLGAYYLGKSQSPVIDNSALLSELDSLRSHESDAAIVKRVSQQMESIAYQQKAISEKQRDKAEQQSKLAMEMRDKAEQESRIAREAETKAVQAADVAVEQRMLALNHQKLAEQQRNQAVLAKNIADTLTHRILGRTLGNTAIIQYDSNPDLADFLALKGWTYLNEYGGNTYQPEIFKALSTCSNTCWEAKMPQLGAVTGICPTDDGSLIGVSDYGEIGLYNQQEQKLAALLQNKSFDFVSVIANKGNVYALSKHGPLLRINNKGQYKSISLPTDRFKTLLEDNSGTLITVGEKTICKYDAARGSVTKLASLDKNLTAIVYNGNIFYLFFSDRSCMEMTSDGKLKSRQPFVNQVVTCAYYDKEDKCLFLGHKNGNITFVNQYGLACTTLESHTSAITTMTSSDGILVSGAYDKMVTIWNLHFLKLSDFGDYKSALTARSRNTSKTENSNISTEWLTPVTYSYSGWPLSCCIYRPGNVAIGMSNGTIQSINISVKEMAAILKARRPETKVPEEEWMKYSIPTTEQK